MREPRKLSSTETGRGNRAPNDLADRAAQVVAETANSDDKPVPAGGISAEFWAAVLKDAAPIYIARADGALLYANRSYWRIAAAIHGDDGHGELPEPHSRLVAEVVASGESRMVREQFPVDGAMRHFTSRHMAVRDTAGRLIAVAGSLNEITRETEAVARATQERQRLNDVMRATSDWFWETDIEGRLTFVSDRITAVLGLPPVLFEGRQLVGLGRFSKMHAQSDDALSAIRAGRPFRDACLEIQSSQGENRVFELSGVPVFDDNGTFRGYRGAGTDVTAQIQAETAARDSRHELETALHELINKNVQLDLTARRATAASHAKQEFLATMSHELRTPLNAIIGFADLVQMQPFGDVKPRYLEYIREISKAGNHLLSIINDCLDVARMEVDALPLHVTDVPLKDILRDARAMVELRAEAKRINISEVDYRGSAEINVDPTRCFQIFVNILSNGVKYTPDGGAIGIDVVADADRAMVEIVVWDTGPGVPAELQESVFDKFQQLHDDILSRTNDGVGLGLGLSRQFARLMGGDVQLNSTPGHGSRFTVSLPLAKASPG